MDYDRENPPIKVGSTYASMSEFRGAVRQHAIKEQFELGTEKSCTERFRGYCKANGCPWAIVARLLHDGHGGKHVRVILLTTPYPLPLIQFNLCQLYVLKILFPYCRLH